jgi:hypothetical protein
MANTKLNKTLTGYITPDGRWVITRHSASGSANMIGGYSQPKNYWVLEDTTRAAIINRGSALPYKRTSDRLYDLRDIIAAVRKDEAEKARLASTPVL